MKNRKYFVSAALLAVAVLGLVGCTEKEPEETTTHRVVYTVDVVESHAALKSDAEWTALLEKLVGYAEEGSLVSFYNADLVSGDKAAQKTANDTCITTDREVIIAWCRQQEHDGKTVTLTYDRTTGTYTGIAYAHRQQEAECYTGRLVYIPNEYGGDYPRYSYWGLKVSEDSVFRLVSNYLYLTTDHPIVIGDSAYSVTDIMGHTVTLCGRLYTQWDAYSDYFVLVLDNSRVSQGEPPLPVYVGEMDGYRLLMTLDEENHRMYCTSTLGDMGWQGCIGGGVFRYEETGETDAQGTPTIRVYNDANGDGHPFLMERRDGVTFVLHDLSYYPQDQYRHTLDGITLHRTYGCWETWVCDTMGFNIVIHLNVEGDVHYRLGLSSAPFYVDCPTPFEAGEFYPDHSNNGWGPMTYTATGRLADLTAGYIDEMTRSLTSNEMSCVGSYVFNRIIRQ